MSSQPPRLKLSQMLSHSLRLPRVYKVREGHGCAQSYIAAFEKRNDPPRTVRSKRGPSPSVGCSGLRLAACGLPVSQETARVLVPAEVSCAGPRAPAARALAPPFRSGQVRYITRPESEAMRVTRQLGLELPPSIDGLESSYARIDRCDTT